MLIWTFEGTSIEYLYQCFHFFASLISSFFELHGHRGKLLVNPKEDSPEKICEALAVCLEWEDKPVPKGQCDRHSSSSPSSRLLSQIKRQHHRRCRISFGKWRTCIGALMLILNARSSRTERSQICKAQFYKAVIFAEVLATLWFWIFACRKCNQNARTRVWFHTSAEHQHCGLCCCHDDLLLKAHIIPAPRAVLPSWRLLTVV